MNFRLFKKRESSSLYDYLIILIYIKYINQAYIFPMQYGQSVDLLAGRA